MEPTFEPVDADAESSFRCLHFECDSFCNHHGWHYHPEYELTWIVRSRGTRFIGDSIQGYVPGDLVLVGPNLPHCWQDAPGAAAEAVVVQFGPDCLGHDFLNSAEAQRLQHFLAQAQHGVHFGRGTAAEVGPQLLELAKAKGLHRPARLLDVLEYLVSAADQTALASPNYQQNNQLANSARARIELVHRYVRDNIGNDIRQTAIAKRVGLSPAAFSRFFHAATGHTFVGFVNILRISAACRLLCSTDRAITDIAMECGYSNIANFNRQFLSNKGINPTEYRRSLRRRDRPPVKNARSIALNAPA